MFRAPLLRLGRGVGAINTATSTSAGTKQGGKGGWLFYDR
jgi:hypothetical protein